MPKANVFNMAGEKIGEIELSEAIFGIEPNKSVLHDSVKNHLANCRQGTQSALTKGRGFRRRPENPGVRRAPAAPAHGYTGSPVWTHGGVAFAPKPRDYSYTLNKKVKRLALKSALSAKAAENEIVVVDGLKVEEIKTNPFSTPSSRRSALRRRLLSLPRAWMRRLSSPPATSPASRPPSPASSAPTMILTNGKFMVVDKAALAKIEEVYA